jgi:predicted RecB family nuclease
MLPTGALSRPHVWDPLLELLWERGARHERGYCEHLEAAGLTVTVIGGIGVDEAAVAQTLAAMRAGASTIVQGALRAGQWGGRADVLRRIETPSRIGMWSYEALDTKLARETKAGAVLQLCLYSGLLAEAQGVTPEHACVVAPWTEYVPQVFRVSDYSAYYRRVKRGLEQALSADLVEQTYPNPIEYCDVCRWRQRCDERRREDDHLCPVAGISKVQINELRRRNVTTLTQLAELPLPLPWRPERGAPRSYERIREQARIQLEGRTAGQLRYELLPVSPECGLPRLPEPTDGDIFLDLEGDPFVGAGGLEYLFGYAFTGDGGSEQYLADWAFSREHEKLAFGRFIDFVTNRLEQWQALHVYHYAPYEPAALKRLMGRYATREDEIDRLLRAGVFVDLYAVVRHGLRVSAETYSIKKLEPLYDFARATPLPQANHALAKLQAFLELGDLAPVAEDDRNIVEGYNRDDCLSTWRLRDWLEEQRAELVANGVELQRPLQLPGDPSEGVAAWTTRLAPIIAQLTEGVPADSGERTSEQHARWLLANMLDWHRREQKAVWWEFFRLADLTAEELLEESAALSGLTFVGPLGGTARAPIHRYTFPPQETELRGDEELRARGGAKLGSVPGPGDDTARPGCSCCSAYPGAAARKRPDGLRLSRGSLGAAARIGTDPQDSRLLRCENERVQIDTGCALHRSDKKQIVLAGGKLHCQIRVRVRLESQAERASLKPDLFAAAAGAQRQPGGPARQPEWPAGAQCSAGAAPVLALRLSHRQLERAALGWDPDWRRGRADCTCSRRGGRRILLPPA